LRLWSIHPRYLDPQGLVALWREALLARAVLRGRTKGYRHHPQLERFRAHATPRSAINTYLAGVHAEATRRGYSFDRSKIGPGRGISRLPVTTGQLAHEWQHLMRKLGRRNPALRRRWSTIANPDCHPSFRRVRGTVESWEKR
jgi:Pyrimidine dimer DNA glycosylase